MRTYACTHPCSCMYTPTYVRKSEYTYPCLSFQAVWVDTRNSKVKLVGEACGQNAVRYPGLCQCPAESRSPTHPSQRPRTGTLVGNRNMDLLCLLQIKARIISTVEESDWIQLKACSARHYHAKQYTSKGAVSSLLNRAQQQGHNQPSHHQLWQKMGQAEGP